MREPSQAREAFRGGLRVPTAGHCPGWTQANLISLPRELAYDFLLFAQRNPKSCPVLDVTEPGETSASIFAGDLRTDLPAYTVYRDGELVEERTEVTELWRADLVSFLVGCSFTFEDALLEAGVPVRHVETGGNVPMFRTNRDCRPAGRLSGPMVVSMRPIPAEQVATAVRVTSRYPAVHGAPVHIGDPAALGIADLGAPDFGEPVRLDPGEIPVFWACGVTPQSVVATAKPEFCITHYPGSMLVTDRRNTEFAIL